MSTLRQSLSQLLILGPAAGKPIIAERRNWDVRISSKWQYDIKNNHRENKGRGQSAWIEEPRTALNNTCLCNLEGCTMMTHLYAFMADLNEQRTEFIKTRLKKLAAQADIWELRVHICNQAGVESTVESSLWRGFQLALIAMDHPNAFSIGVMLYRQNPSCRLIYYHEGATNLCPWLPTRPVWYWDCADFSGLDAVIRMQLKSMRRDPGFFTYEDRLRGFSVPYSYISCFISQNRAVYIHTCGEDMGPLRRSLDHIEKLVPKELFIRVHQSFLVSRTSIRRLDRGKRELVLTDGFCVPVSKALFEQTASLFGKNDRLADQNDILSE